MPLRLFVRVCGGREGGVFQGGRVLSLHRLLEGLGDPERFGGHKCPFQMGTLRHRVGQ